MSVEGLARPQQPAPEAEPRPDELTAQSRPDPEGDRQIQLLRTDRCPLCGTALHAQQEWCLACGSAARTRLAVTPNWRLPVMILTLIALASLGILLAALVKLA